MKDDTLRTDGGTATITNRLRRNVEQMTIADAGLYVVLLLAAGFYLVPIESGLVTSIKTGTAIVETAPFGLVTVRTADGQQSLPEEIARLIETAPTTEAEV